MNSHPHYYEYYVPPFANQWGHTHPPEPAVPFSELWMGHPHLSDIPNYPNNYMAAASEVSSEVKLLNDFLHTSMLDDGMALGAPNQQLDGALFGNGMVDAFSSLNGNGPMPSAQGGPPAALNAMSMLQNMPHQNQSSMMPPPGLPNGHHHGAPQLSRPSVPTPSRNHHLNTSSQGSSSQNQITLPSIKVLQRDRDKAARDYYLQAADPIGADTPEERMQRLLKAKYEAGLLKPFNYIRGYQKLSAYLDSHIAPASKQKIVKCLDRFRPKFREIAQALTDVELVVVEMWFEKQLMEYDRVFASMAVPACLWRRTGEIYRGNKEMAELLRVPVEKLRDGSIALHQIMTEDSMVRYWEEFETIAFDPDHDTLLTACTLKDPAVARPAPGARMVNCAFSFMIHRDDYKMPTLIIGNFLPHDPGN